MSEYFTINKRLIAGILTKYKTTFDAFCELITNSIQARSKNIWIDIDRAAILSSSSDSEYKRIQIRDDGTGVSKSEFKAKILDIATDSKREQGGKGVGRFAALQLGSKMVIETTAPNPTDRKHHKTTLVVDTKNWQEAQPLDKIPLEVNHEELTTEPSSYYAVNIFDFYSADETKAQKHLRMLKCFSDSSLERALFERYTETILKEHTRFFVNGKLLAVRDHLIGEIEESAATFTSHEGIEHELRLQFMQVKGNKIGHKVFLRVKNGEISTVAHSLDYMGDIPAENQWIVFVDSPFFGSDTDACRGLLMSDLNPDTELLSKEIKGAVDAFFSKKYAEYYDFRTKLETDPSYPYRERNASSTSRISVFNQLAFYIEEKHHLLTRKSDIRNLVYGLVDRSLNLGGFEELISKVLKVDNSMAIKFKGLLEQVDLEDVVAFCDDVKIKEQFLDFLYKLNYDPISKHVKERSQLHKMVQRHLWLFGEQYNNSPLLFSDKNLRNNLEQLRYKYFDYPPSEDDDNLIADVDEELKDITDLFFFNEKLLHGDQKEIMIVELKAPSVKLGVKELNQAKRYALQIQSTGAFPDGLIYKIILIGADVTPFLKAEFGQRDQKHPHLVHKTNPPKVVEVWTMKWSDLIDENRRKLSYMGNQLATKDREVNEFWQTELGEVPTKEIFSKLRDTEKPTKKRKPK